MPVGSMDKHLLKPSHVHCPHNATSAASPKARTPETFPRCKKGMLPKRARGWCLEKVYSRDGETGTIVGKKETRKKRVKNTKNKMME